MSPTSYRAAPPRGDCRRVPAGAEDVKHDERLWDGDGGATPVLVRARPARLAETSPNFPITASPARPLSALRSPSSGALDVFGLALQRRAGIWLADDL